MSPRTPDMTPADHVARAKAELAAGDHQAAQTHALIAIAEQGQPADGDEFAAGVRAGIELATTMLDATAEALDTVDSAIGVPTMDLTTGALRGASQGIRNAHAELARVGAIAVLRTTA